MTLAQAVSNKLMTDLPRISPELFERGREAKVPLSEEQKEQIERYVYREIEAHRSRCTQVKSLVKANLPLFFYAPVCEEKISFPKQGIVSGSVTIEAVRTIKTIYSDRSEGFLAGSRLNNLGSSATFNWEAPFKLDVHVKCPKVPEGFIELGDEAIAEYYDAVRRTPKELRKRTQLASPQLGVLWAPTDETLYCTGEIPEPRPLEPEGDPALILDIPDGDISYKHVVAVWDIGEERPLRNWLAEYTESRR